MAKQEIVAKDVDLSKVDNFQADFDKLGGEEVHFDRPMASFKKIKKNLVVGKLVHHVLLNKPKNMQVEDSEDPNENLFGCFIVKLNRPCLALEGDKIITVAAGREVYLPETAKLRELHSMLGKEEMYTIAVVDDGTQFINSFEMQKYRIRILGEPVKRHGHFLIGGPQTVHLAPAQLSPVAAIPQGTVPYTASGHNAAHPAQA